MHFLRTNPIGDAYEHYIDGQKVDAETFNKLFHEDVRKREIEALVRYGHVYLCDGEPDLSGASRKGAVHTLIAKLIDYTCVAARDAFVADGEYGLTGEVVYLPGDDMAKDLDCLCDGLDLVADLLFALHMRQIEGKLR